MAINKPISILLASIFLFFSQEIKAACFYDNFYLKVEGGAVLTGDFTAQDLEPNLQINDLGRSWMHGAGIGYVLNEDFRLEAKVSARRSMRYQYFSESISTIDLTVGKLKNTTATLGIFYQLFHINGAHPYIGLGGGYSKNTLYDNQQLANLDVGRATPLDDVSTTNFCFFISSGTLIDLAMHWQLDISGSYFNLGKVGPILANRAELNNIAVFELNLGLIYKF